MRLSVLTSNRRAKKKCRHARVSLNGVDVTTRCQVADAREGWVVLMRLNARGRPYIDLDRDEVARERLHGRVRITTAPRRRIG